jgi:hypothetical protein
MLEHKKERRVVVEASVCLAPDGTLAGLYNQPVTNEAVTQAHLSVPRTPKTVKEEAEHTGSRGLSIVNGSTATPLKSYLPGAGHDNQHTLPGHPHAYSV